MVQKNPNEFLANTIFTAILPQYYVRCMSVFVAQLAYGQHSDFLKGPRRHYGYNCNI